MWMRKKDSKFPNNASLLVDIHVWIGFLHADIKRKDTLKQGTSSLLKIALRKKFKTLQVWAHSTAYLYLLRDWNPCHDQS